VVEVERVGLVEAMASHRPYRPPCGLQAALKEISQNRELLYAPEVVDACVKLFTEKGFTLESDRGQGG
jgi:HD-GYP domain-containing protein (c-di-GMP phosphodiesterase class II)